MGNNKAPRRYFHCDYCGIIASDKPSAYIKKKRHFCSIKCYAIFQKELLPREEHNSLGHGYSQEERILRRRARYALNHAIRDGKIIKKTCEKCGNEKSEAHHEDYNKPLEVVWLCFKHHRELHGHKIYEHPELLKSAA